MTANTVTGQQLLVEVAQHTGEFTASYVSTVTTQTNINALGIRPAKGATLKNALAYVPGKGINTVLTYDEADEKLTFTSGFTGTLAVGDPLLVCWWDGLKRLRAWEAINHSIAEAYPRWWREIVTDINTSTITLVQNTYTYALPTDLVELYKVGVQQNAITPIQWFDPERLWRQEGEEGAFVVRFHPNYNGGGGYIRQDQSHVHVYDNAGGTLSDAFATYKLCLWYKGREAEMTSETGTTELPLSYFANAALNYLEMTLPTVRDPAELQRLTLL